jgi:hypothetical protein
MRARGEPVNQVAARFDQKKLEKVNRGAPLRQSGPALPAAGIPTNRPVQQRGVCIPGLQTHLERCL